MPTTYTSLIGLALPTTGELTGTWGTTVNDYITKYVDAAVAGTQTLSTDADVTLTVTNGSNLGATSAQYAILNCTGARTVQRTITVPAASKSYLVINGTTGGQTVKVVGAGPTTGVTLANGERALIAWNGSDFVKVGSSVTDLSNVTGTLGAANGGTGLTAPGTLGNLLTSNGTAWVSSPPAAITAVTTFSGGTTGLTPSTPTSGAVSLGGTLAVANGGTGQTTYTDGQLLIGNTTGNTLTKATLTAGTGVTITNGAGSITIAAAGGMPAQNIVTGTTQTAVANNQYVLTNAAATTVTLPSSPSAGDIVWVTVANDLTTNVIARNGQNIMGLAEDMTLNAKYAAAQLRFADATRGWRMV